MEHAGQVGADGFGFDNEADAELARAIEASYMSQTDVGMGASEDELFAEALRLSALEEEERKRRELGLALSPEDEAFLGIDGAGRDSAGSGARGAPSAASRATADTGAAAGRWQPGSDLGAGVSVEDDFAAIAASGLLNDNGGNPRTRAPLGQGMDDDFAAIAASGLLERSLPPSDGAMNGGGRGMGGLLGEQLAPGAMDADAMAAAAVAEQAEMSDRQLAMAIEASYVAQTSDGRLANEDDLMAQALKISQQEEDARSRAGLREEQEMELRESELMDQMREEEQKRRRIEEQELQKMEAERVQEEAARRENEGQHKKEMEEQKRSRIPEEPPTGEPGRVDCMIRLPDGKRVRRAFRGTDVVGQVYDYIDVEAGEAVAAMSQYRLVTTMPRQAYEDRALTLEDAGLKGQCALIIEAIQS